MDPDEVDDPAVTPRRWSRTQQVAGVLGLVVVAAVVEAGFDHLRTVQERSTDRFAWRLQSHLLANAMLALCLPGVVWLARRFPVSGTGAVRATLIHAAGGFSFGAAHLSLVALEQRFLLGNPEPLLRWTLYLVSWYMVRDLLVYCSIVGVLQAVWNQRALRRRQVEALQLRASLSEARMDALRMQLRPHFLFNVLNTAAMLVREGQPAKGIMVLEELGGLLRQVLHEPGRGDVTIREELDFLGSYLDLERIRFEDRLRVNLVCAADVAEIRVPFLLLQPLVENAVRHGVSRRAGPVQIDVSATRGAAGIRLEVKDSGAGLPPGGTAQAGGIGLANVRQRLAERYGAAARLGVEALPVGGTVAWILLPEGA